MTVPSHVAIIMDGNGRWAEERNMPRREGHKEGVRALRKVVKAAPGLGIKCLTVYAFSTENWTRPGEEVEFLLNLFKQTLRKEARELGENNVKIQIIGRRRGLPEGLKREIVNLEEETSVNDGLHLNIAFNYGGRAEIIDACKKVLHSNSVEEIDEEEFNKYLYSTEYPEVELLIRTGGEKRLSNFLLWESAYAELIFTEKFWPDFTGDDLREAVVEFERRERRFGGINC